MSDFVTQTRLAEALGGHDHVDYSWLDELPTHLGPPDLKMGLRNLDLSRWFPVDDLTQLQRSAKLDILAAHPEVVQWQDSALPACDELLALVVEYTAAQPEPGLHPIDAAARLVAEDLSVMVRSDQATGSPGSWRLAAGSLAFGNQWTMAEKIGGSLLDIHEPTDGYAELLAAKVDTFFDNLRPGRLAWRRNWFVHDIDDYHQPVKFVHQHTSDPRVAGTLWIRSERETLRRLPETGAIVFTIKTQIAPMVALLARPAKAEEVADHLAAATDRGLRAKDADGRAAALISYLRSA